MSRASILRIRILAMILIILPVSFSQSRRSTRRDQPAPARPPFLQQAVLFEESPDATKLVLKNGLTILVEEFKPKPVVSIQMHVQAGFLDETAHERGAALLVPSLICRRPSNKSGGTLEQNVYAFGGMLRASTEFRDASFEIVAPSDQWKRGLNLLAEAIANPSFDAEDILPEKNLLENEARSADDDPNAFSKNKWLELAFDSSRLDKYGATTENSWRSLGSKELAAFFKKYYVPSRMTLVLSGDIGTSEVLNEIVRTYGKWSATSKPETASLNLPSTGFRYRLHRANILFPQMILGFNSVVENASDYRALEALSAMIGLGEGSVLKFRLRDQDHLIFSGETDFYRLSNFGCLSIRMEMDPKDIDASQIAILTEVELLKRQGPSEADLARAVAQLELNYWRRMESVTERAGTLASFDSVGDWKGRDRYVADLKKVSLPDIRRAAAKYLRLENCSLLEFLPREALEERNPTVEGVRRTLEGLLDPSADQEQAKREKEMVPFLKIPQDVGGFRFSEVQYPFQVASILRGPEMYIREDHTAPVLTMGVFFPGGKFFEGEENAGITRLMVDLLRRGSLEMQADRFYSQLELYGGQMEPVVEDDYFGFNFSILSNNFEEGYNLLKQILKAPDFDKEDVARQSKAQIRELFRRRSSEEGAEDLLKQYLFRGSSYAQNGLGTEASLNGITPADLVEWHSQYIKNRKPFVVIIGDTKGTSLARFFVKEFSGSRMQDSKIPGVWVQPPIKGELIEKDWKKKQSLILIGFQAPPVEDEDGYTVTVLENLLDNPGGLAQEVRYKLGSANGVSVVYAPRLRGGSLVASATANPGSEAAVLEAMQKGLRRAVSDPFTYKECRSAVNAAAGTYEITNQYRNEQIKKIVILLMAGKTIEDFQNFPKVLQAVNETDLADIARRILNVDKAVVVKMHSPAN